MRPRVQSPRARAHVSGTDGHDGSKPTPAEPEPEPEPGITGGGTEAAGSMADALDAVIKDPSCLLIAPLLSSQAPLGRSARKNRNRRRNKKLRNGTASAAPPAAPPADRYETTRAAIAHLRARLERGGGGSGERLRSVKWNFLADCWGQSEVNCGGMRGAMVAFDARAGEAFVGVLDAALAGCGGDERANALVNKRKPMRKLGAPAVTVVVDARDGGNYTVARTMTRRGTAWKQDTCRLEPASMAAEAFGGPPRELSGAKEVDKWLARYAVPNPASGDTTFLRSCAVPRLLDAARGPAGLLAGAVRAAAAAFVAAGSPRSPGPVAALSVCSDADMEREAARAVVRAMLRDASRDACALRAGGLLVLDGDHVAFVETDSADPTPAERLRCAEASVAAVALRTLRTALAAGKISSPATLDSYVGALHSLTGTCAPRDGGIVDALSRDPEALRKCMRRKTKAFSTYVQRLSGVLALFNHAPRGTVKGGHKVQACWRAEHRDAAAARSSLKKNNIVTEKMRDNTLTLGELDVAIEQMRVQDVVGRRSCV
jgi:hypothetical protein